MASRNDRADIHINSQRLGKLIQDLHMFKRNKVSTQRRERLDKSPTVMKTLLAGDTFWERGSQFSPVK